MRTERPDRRRVSRGTRRSRAWILLLTLGLGMSGGVAPAILRAQAPAGQPAAGGGLTPEVIAQIDALEQEKNARTPAERKVDSQLLYALRAAQGLPVANGVQSLQTDLPADAAGRVTVDITALVTPELQADVAGRGGAVVSAIAGTSSMRATLNLAQVLAIAARPDVVWIQPRQIAFTSRRADAVSSTGFELPSPGRALALARHLGTARRTFVGDAGFARRADRLATTLRAALARTTVAYGTSPGGSGPTTNVPGGTTGQAVALTSHSE